MLVHLLVAAGVVLVVWWLLQDCDLVLRFYKMFGRSDYELKGKVAWITGAGGGIGSCLSIRWASRGLRLVLADLNEAALQSVKARCIAASHGQLKDEDILLLPGDITKLDEHPRLLRQVLDHFGKLDILINNAGRAVQGSFDVVTTDIDRMVFDVNVTAPVSLARTVLPYFKKHNAGHIVTTCSIVGKFPLARLSTYSASKAAVLSFFTALRMELANTNISVTTICPGPVKTPLLRDCNKDGKTFDVYVPNLPPFMNEMRPDRCAELMSVAVANRMHEVWISSQPCMINFYTQQYTPIFCEWSFTKIALPILDRWAARQEPSIMKTGVMEIGTNKHD